MSPDGQKKGHSGSDLFSGYGLGIRNDELGCPNHLRKAIIIKFRCYVNGRDKSCKKCPFFLLFLDTVFISILAPDSPGAFFIGTKQGCNVAISDEMERERNGNDHIIPEKYLYDADERGLPHVFFQCDRSKRT